MPNFEPANQRDWIRRRYYPTTPKVVAKTLRWAYHHHSDEKACGEWIKDYSSEANVRALGGVYVNPNQTEWLGKKANTKLLC